MLDKKVAGLLNEQLNKEFYSAYLYLDFANWFEDAGLAGFAHWYEVQAQEELDHALAIRTYLCDSGCRVRLDAIARPDKTFEAALMVLEAGLAHERYISASINEVYAGASEVKDFRTMQFLDAFVKEQGEEEKNAEDLIKKMKLFGGDARSLYLLDKDLAARVYAPFNAGTETNA